MPQLVMLGCNRQLREQYFGLIVMKVTSSPNEFWFKLIQHAVTELLEVMVNVTTALPGRHLDSAYFIGLGDLTGSEARHTSLPKYCTSS